MSVIYHSPCVTLQTVDLLRSVQKEGGKEREREGRREEARRDGQGGYICAFSAS